MNQEDKEVEEKEEKEVQLLTGTPGSAALLAASSLFCFHLILGR